MTTNLPAVRKLLFIGTNNPRGDEPFWPKPHGSTGHKLWQLINDAVGWDADEFLMRVDRINVVDTPSWNEARAKERVGEILAQCEGRRVIVVGRVTAALLGAPGEPFIWDGGLAMIPHTSGLNRFYNDADNRDQVVAFLREALQ